ncbi:MAG: DUF87 domain-containing protein [Candidatus Micrarchaeota archaeon]
MAGGLKVLHKHGDELGVAFGEGDKLKIGDCVLVSDGEMQVVAQAYDLQYGGLRKVFTDLLDSLEGPNAELAREINDKYGRQLSSFRLAKCKIRGTVKEGRFSPGLLKLPADNAAVKRLSEQEIVSLLGFEPKKPANIGKMQGSGLDFAIDLASLQGVTLITGRKGSGKSHLAKKLLEELLANNAPAVVLDVNGEYASLKNLQNGGESGLAGGIVELVPGRNFFIPLDGISFETFARMCQIEENHNAFRLFARYWAENAAGKSLKDLKQWVELSKSTPGSMNAALARIDYAASLGVFGEFNFRQALEKARFGGAVVLNMFRQGEKVKELSIVYILRQLISAGLRDEGKIFLFAEEAQNYFEKEFWDDVITRMRHLGIYSVIITNEPTTLPSMVFRQCDNLFTFNFSSDNDIAFVSSAQVIDPASLGIVKNLGVGQCIAIGKCTNNFPLLLHVSQTRGRAGGQTKLLWE